AALPATGRERQLEPSSRMDANGSGGRYGREQVVTQVRLGEVDFEFDLLTLGVDLDVAGPLGDDPHVASRTEGHGPDVIAQMRIEQALTGRDDRCRTRGQACDQLRLG